MCKPVVKAIVLLIGVSAVLVGANIRAQVMEDVCSGMQVSKNFHILPRQELTPMLSLPGSFAGI